MREGKHYFKGIILIDPTVHFGSKSHGKVKFETRRAQVKAYYKKYYAKNKERLLEQGRAYRRKIKQALRYCRCGKPLPKHKNRYCSESCQKFYYKLFTYKLGINVND